MADVLLENEISRYGLRSVHVIGPKRIERERWMQRLPETAIDTLTVVDRLENEVGVWHMHLCWQARELVPVKMVAVRDPLSASENIVIDAVFWWVGQAYGEEERPATLREAADLAASTWWLAKGSWPARCLVRTLPKTATSEVEVGWGWFAEGAGPRVKLEEAYWVPKGFVVVL